MAGEEKKKVSEAQKRATRTYVDATYERLELKFRKDENWRARIDAHCRQYGYESEQSKDGIGRTIFIKKAIETQMAIDRGELKLTKPRKKKEEK